MRKELFDQYLREYVRQALIYADDDVADAATYLKNQKKPGWFAKSEKKQALKRAQKIFSAYQDRPVWFILKCLAIEPEELDRTSSLDL